MRSKDEIRSLIEGFAKSRMTRREFCAKHRIGMSTLDYWRRTRQKQNPTLVQVALEEGQPRTGFALVLANGRRIESGWSFTEADLQRLIQAAEV